MREIAGVGLYVKGKLDLDDSEVAREAWRSMQDNRVALSFGYIAVKSRSAERITDLLELDLFEISIVPSPANPQTRILEMKSAAISEREPPRAPSDKIALEGSVGLGAHPDPTLRCRGEGGPTDAELRQHAARLGIALPPTHVETRQGRGQRTTC